VPRPDTPNGLKNNPAATGSRQLHRRMPYYYSLKPVDRSVFRNHTGDCRF
jgi:hypothetical protein